MADTTSGLSFARSGVSFGHRLNRFRNLAIQGAAELAERPAYAAPPSDYYIEIGDKAPVFRRPGKPGEVEINDATLAQLADKMGKAPLDLVFVGDSCFDLKFRLPDALLPEMRQIIDNEIQYRSPFSEDASLWFWVAEELPDHHWQARAAVALKQPVEALLTQMRAHKLRIGAVRRDTKDVRFAAYPDWTREGAAPPRKAGLWRSMPGFLKLAIAGAAIFTASAAALAVKNSVMLADLRAEADVARAEISARAQASASLRSLDAAIARSADKLALTGQLSELLPDGVWLDQLVIEDDTVTLIGFAPSAAEITRLLAGLPQLSDIRFASPVTRDNTQSLERFRIAATLTAADP